MSRPCPNPLDARTIIDYWFEELPDVDPIEEHLLSCDGCGERLRELLELRDSVRQATVDGAIPFFVSDAFLEKASALGLRSREYRVPAGGQVQCTVTQDDDLLIGRLEADFTGAERIDLLLRIGDHPEQRIEDVPLNPASGELIWSQPMPLMRPMGRVTLRVRAMEAGGPKERLLGEFTFNHYPTPA